MSQSVVGALNTGLLDELPLHFLGFNDPGRARDFGDDLRGVSRRSTQMTPTSIDCSTSEESMGSAHHTVFR